MATSASARQSDYFASRPIPRTRTSGSGFTSAVSPNAKSPRTPLVGRSISGQFGSPGALSREPEEVVVYELHPRFLSAGFAGEGKPRCVHRFGYQPGDGRRVGDFRHFFEQPKAATQRPRDDARWSAPYELFSVDVGDLDFALLQDRLERALRNVHTEYLQLDSTRSRKAVLVLPPLFPTPLLEITLRVLFTHHAQPPTITLLTTPVLSCVSSGLRSALVVDIGWEETVVTAVGEHKPVAERRSVRGGKMMVREMAALLKEVSDGHEIDFPFAEDVTRRLAWCRRHLPAAAAGEGGHDRAISIPLPNKDAEELALPFSRLSEPANKAFFGHTTDDHDLPIPSVMGQALLALPVDLRALCVSRIVITGSNSAVPGLKPRLLLELSEVIAKRGWDVVENYGTAKDPLPARLRSRQLSAAAKPLPNVDGPTPTRDRVHDDISDRLSQQVLHTSIKDKEKVVKGVVRGVESLGAWSGASLVASMKVKGVTEVEREELLNGAWREKVLS